MTICLRERIAHLQVQVLSLTINSTREKAPFVNQHRVVYESQCDLRGASMLGAH